MHIHRWVTVEQIGRVVTQRCRRCGKTRTRVRGAVREYARTSTPRRPDALESGSEAATAPHRSNAGGSCAPQKAKAVRHRTSNTTTEVCVNETSDTDRQPI